MGNTLLKTGENAKDEWTMGQGGFRMDWNITKKNQLSLQSNVYSGKPDPDGASPIVASGENIIAKWNHKSSEKSDFQVQAYYDHTWRDLKNGVTQDLKTYDIDWQNRYQAGKQHVLTYGLGARLMDDREQNLELFTYLPAHKMLNLYSAFLQDEITLVKERLRFIIGSKIEHNSYTGFEYEPNVRLALTPTKKQTMWAAVSRAVRMPSRTDRDFSLSIAPNFPIIQGSENFISETLLAYELGWRLQPYKKLSISLSTFYNEYDNIRSAAPGPPPFTPYPITLSNDVKGETYGAEFSANYQLTSWWHLRGGYTFLKKNLWVKQGSIDLNGATSESEDPQNQFLVQSTVKLPGRVEISSVLRYIDLLPKPYYVHSSTELDMRVGWKLNKLFEFDIVGQNLMDNTHAEFVATTPPHLIERSVYGKIICRF
jgi:iron complex outermembrane receptor protein